MGAQGGEFARQPVDDGFLLLFELEVHFGGRHGAGVAHGDVACVCAGEVG